MKTKTYLLVAVAILSGYVISSLAQQSAAQRNIVEFEIEVSIDPVENGVKFKCIDGCAWEALSFSCGPGVECASSIDEYGIPAE